MTSHLQRMQNYAAGVILRISESSSISIFKMKKARSTYKIVCATTATAVLHYHMSLTCCRKSHRTRSSSHTMPLLHRPAHSKATLADRSFSFASSFVWNSISNVVRCTPSPLSHMSRLKTFMFRSVYKGVTFSLITVQMCLVCPCY